MLSSGQEFDEKFLDSKHVLKVYFKPSRKKNILYFYHFLFCLSGSRIILRRNINFQEFERRKSKKARILSKASAPEEEARIYRDEDRFEVQDDSNPVLSTLAPSIVEKGKLAFSKLRVE